MVLITTYCKSNGIPAPGRVKARRLTALHEAGHCVLALHFDRCIGSVSIVAHGEFSGSCDGDLDLSEEPSEEDIQGRLAELLAGHAAVVRAEPRFARWSRLKAGDDIEKAKSLFMASRDQLRTALQRAHRIVDAEWKAINAIADALLEHKTIGGQEAQLIVDAMHGHVAPDRLAELLARSRGHGGIGGGKRVHIDITSPLPR
jgi:ATP-dependent Zn protease